MMISNVRGRFEDFSGTVAFDDTDLARLAVTVEFTTASINTREEARDAHLRSEDFFDSDRFPVATFVSTGTDRVSGNRLKLAGELTIRGVTHPVVLDVEYSGVAQSPWGTTSAGFSAHARINRKEWGLEWNQVLEAGGLLVGEEVKLDIDLELVKMETPELASAG